MNKYDFYYPNRFRQKTKNFDNIYNEWKSVENTWGSGDKEYQIIDKYFGKGLPSEIRNSKLFSFHEYRRFEKGGSNIFHFRKGLLELLEKTDVSIIPIGAIKFPFHQFYISLRELEKPLYPSISDDTVIDGVYVEFTDNSKEDLIYQYDISFHVCGYSEKRKDSEFKYNVEDIMELTSGLTFENSNSTITDAIAEVHKIMKDTIELDKRPKEQLDREINAQLDAYTLLKDNLNLFINCILYITSEQPDLETKFVDGLPLHLKSNIDKANTKHRKQIAEAEAIKFGYSKIKLVGNAIGQSVVNGNLTGETLPHWRRGHWRNQPFGRDLSESKIIWIKPTIVKREKGDPIKGHIYTTE